MTSSRPIHVFVFNDNLKKKKNPTTTAFQVTTQTGDLNTHFAQSRKHQVWEKLIFCLNSLMAEKLIETDLELITIQIRRYYSYSAKKDKKFKLNTKNIAPNKKRKKKKDKKMHAIN